MPRKKKSRELLLTYHESRHGGAAINPDDSWTEHEDEYIDFYIEGVFVDDDNKRARDKSSTWYKETLSHTFDVKPGDQIWVVVIRYYTGGTFGRTCGAWKIDGVYQTAEEANKIEADIESDEKAYREWCWRNPGYKSEKEPFPKEKYKKDKCWRGHFEGFERVEVRGFTVL